jgi:hypothetical protein
VNWEPRSSCAAQVSTSSSRPQYVTSAAQLSRRPSLGVSPECSRARGASRALRSALTVNNPGGLGHSGYKSQCFQTCRHHHRVERRRLGLIVICGCWSQSLLLPLEANTSSQDAALGGGCSQGSQIPHGCGGRRLGNHVTSFQRVQFPPGSQHT